MPNGNASNLESWVRDMDGKIDKLLEGMVRMETKADNQHAINTKTEEQLMSHRTFISEFKQKIAFFEGQQAMIKIVGGAVAGAFIIWEVLHVVLK